MTRSTTVLFTLTLVLLSTAGCRSKERKEAARLVDQIGTACATTADCGEELACAFGTTSGSNQDAGFSCQKVCDLALEDQCPEGTECVNVISGPGSSLGTLCFRSKPSPFR